MCFGGGGGGGAPPPKDDTYEKMEAAEKKRREEENARRKTAIAQIDAIYADPTRKTLYDKAHKNHLNLLMDGLKRTYGDNKRDIRFGLARQGLAGGSVDLDEMSKLSNAFGRGVIEANREADSLIAGMRADDENTRANLISRINSGMEADSAASLAANQMKANYQQKISAPPTNLDGIFNGVGSFWNGFQQGRGLRDGQQYKPRGQAVGGYNGRLS